MSRPTGLWLSWLRERRHLSLLIAIAVYLATYPLLVHWNVHARIAADAFFALLVFGVFLVVFEQWWQRWLALGLVLVAVASNFSYYASTDWWQMVALIFNHSCSAAFLGIAVVVILQSVFRRETVRGDDIIGAACGFLLAAFAWGNLYALVYVIAPGSFHVPDDIAWQLHDWHTRRALFNYFSVVTLTTVGYGDITPTSAPAYALVTLEVVFGLFYLAVVVAQLVGLMMVGRATKKKSS